MRYSFRLSIVIFLFITTTIISCDYSAKFKMSKVWKYPGGEAPPMKMIFEKNGTLRFEGGFLFYNPSYWRYDDKKEELIIRIPAFTDSDLAVITAIQRRQSVREYDGSKKRNFIIRSPEYQNKLIFAVGIFQKTQAARPNQALNLM